MAKEVRIVVTRGKLDSDLRADPHGAFDESQRERVLVKGIWDYDLRSVMTGDVMLAA